MRIGDRDSDITMPEPLREKCRIQVYTLRPAKRRYVSPSRWIQRVTRRREDMWI